MTELEQQLETFRENFRYTKLYVWDDMIVYKIQPKFATAITLEANQLIDELGLDLLVAESDATSFLFRDTMRVKQK